jgi:hypothetical protein
MPDRALEFSKVIAGYNVRGYWHIYYRRYFVGTIRPAGDDESWRVTHLDVDMGRFDSIDEATRAVEEWYYGCCASPTPPVGEFREKNF